MCRTRHRERRRTRRAERREATKAEILDAAWALVREHGLGALALRDLAARVGMRAPSLYQYFDSKTHAIYGAMFASRAPARHSTWWPRRSRATDTREALLETARRMFEFGSTSDAARAAPVPTHDPRIRAVAGGVRTGESRCSKTVRARDETPRHHRSRRDGPVDGGHQRVDESAES